MPLLSRRPAITARAAATAAARVHTKTDAHEVNTARATACVAACENNAARAAVARAARTDKKVLLAMTTRNPAREIPKTSIRSTTNRI